MAPVPPGVRPTSDRLRETLFGVLDAAVEGSVWLEPFAGTGAVALEALSRGARRLILNDSSSPALDTLRRNLTLCEVEAGFEVSGEDVFGFLRRLRVPGVDFIFLDPPYEFRRYPRLLTAVADLSCLKPTTLIILELFKKTLLEVPEVLELSRRMSVGESSLLLMQPRIPEHQSKAAGTLP